MIHHQLSPIGFESGEVHGKGSGITSVQRVDIVDSLLALESLPVPTCVVFDEAVEILEAEMTGCRADCAISRGRGGKGKPRI